MPYDTILIGCGVLEKESRHLISKNAWELDSVFLDSALHTDFDRLYKAIEYQLRKNAGRRKLISYGSCHPRIDYLAAGYGAVKLPVQNCVEMVLGKEEFAGRSAERAFFLFEDWAVGWERVVRKLFGTDPGLIGEIFQSEHSYLLALKTPCSGDFSAEAEMISQQTGLPLNWLDVGLENFERHLAHALEAFA